MCGVEILDKDLYAILHFNYFLPLKGLSMLLQLTEWNP